MTQQQPNPRRTPRLARPRRLVVALATVGLVALAACGGGDDSDDEGGLSAAETTATTEASGGDRTVDVEMADNEFSPSEIEVAAGETVRFVFTNTGEVTHDAVIGDEAAQMEHEDEMRAAESTGMDDSGMDDGGMGHGEAESEGATTVEPGSTGELMHTFSAGDEVLIGCHQPGHYDAGMILSVNVTDA